MKEQYIENTFPRYFIHGVYDDGIHVDVHDRDKLIAHHIPKERADKLCEERDKAVSMIIKLAKRLDEVSPEDFNEVWYGIKRDKERLDNLLGKLGE
jgi:hypothetical protein